MSVFSTRFMRSIVESKPETKRPVSSFLVKPHASPANHDGGADIHIFDDLHSEVGFLTVESYYLKRKSQSVSDRFDELTFVDFMRRVGDVPDALTLDLFDFLDVQDNGSVQFEEFFLCLAMMAARECGMTTKLLYVHAERLFRLAGGQYMATIPAQSVFTVTYLLSMPEKSVRELLSPYSLNRHVSKDEFVLLLFVICRWWDERYAIRSNELERRSSNESDVLIRRFRGATPLRGHGSQGNGNRRNGALGPDEENPGFCKKYCVIS